MELQKSDMIAYIDTSVHKPIAHAEMVSRANYGICSIKLHVYANVILSTRKRRERSAIRMNGRTRVRPFGRT